MIRLLATLALLATPAVAETARVISGEHANFTRLVVELPAEAEWTVGRTPMGYAFASGAEAQPDYDLSRVWQRIPRTRLQALRVDAGTGILQLMLACACHVFPFEYRPGMVVLDIKDGPAPPGSAFEDAFTVPDRSEPEPPLAATEMATYDWLNIGQRTTAAGADLLSGSLPAAGVITLDPLRDELLEQISRGAAGGVIDMQLPGKPPRTEPAAPRDFPWARISIGEMPGLRVTDPKIPPDALLPDGGACLPDDVLALPEWGAGRTPLDLLTEARSGLYGEFDVVDPAAVLQAIRLHLYLGFGAEAAQYGAFLAGQTQPEELATYLSMARLIEGSQDPGTPFAGMLSCDGPAALWAALAHTRLPQGRAVNSDAILRGFLALPPHLRALLGPGLAEKLQERGDAVAARMIRDTLARTPDIQTAAVSLLDATAELRADRPESARAHARAAIAEDEGNPDGLIALVETHFRQADPLPPDVAASLRAILGEAGARAAPPDQNRALVLALALSGQTDAAFATADALDLDSSDLWHVVQRLATDDAFLRHAVLPGSGPVPGIRPVVRLAVSTRLVDLGFAEAGLAWLGRIEPSDGEAERRLAARAELARGDAIRGLALLDGLTDPGDEALRATALVQVGALVRARQAYKAAGMTDQAERLLAWERNWAGLQAGESEIWSDAAAAALPFRPAEAGPLARGAALVDDSAATRGAVETLLTSVATPLP